MNVRKQGETVKLLFVAAMPSTGYQQTPIWDSNNAPRALQPYERLLIDSVQGTADAGYLFLATNTFLTTSTLICVTGPNALLTLEYEDNEGYSCPVGATPYLIAASTASVIFSAEARIINGTTQGVRPSWRESLVSRGNS